MQMRLYRNIFLTIAAAAAFVQSLHAQNLDPTVEVNRAYEGKLMEVHKPVLDMEVPDTVMRFDLDFDYSVFESPYKGSYEFNPYLLSMKPGSSGDSSHKFYLRAGAGYQFHPQLDLVWSPKIGKGFKMDVYANHRSFVGEYWNQTGRKGAKDVMILDRLPKSDADRSWKGHDVMNKAGFDARHDWKKGLFTFGADYFGIIRKNMLHPVESYNAVDAFIGLANKKELEDSFHYDFRLDYRYGTDRYNVQSYHRMNEHIAGLKGSFGPVIKDNHKVLFDLGIESAFYCDGADATFGGQAYLLPHYILEKGPFMLDLGVRMAVLLHKENYDSNYTNKGQFIYPNVRMHFALLPNAMRFYIHAGGGNKMNTYSSLVSANHHISPRYHTVSNDEPLLDYTVERVSLVSGFEGRISSRFSYNLRAGYVYYDRNIVDVLKISEAPYSSSAYIGYGSYEKWFAGLDWCLDMEGFRFDGSVVYGNSWGKGLETAGFIRPADFQGNIAAEYNWKRRVFLGADCEFASARKGNAYIFEQEYAPEYLTQAKVPGYADLGLYAEYVTSRSLAFWVRGGNLLNMTVQRNLMYAEKGPYFTVGICLNL